MIQQSRKSSSIYITTTTIIYLDRVDTITTTTTIYLDQVDTITTTTIIYLDRVDTITTTTITIYLDRVDTRSMPEWVRLRYCGTISPSTCSWGPSCRGPPRRTGTASRSRTECSECTAGRPWSGRTATPAAARWSRSASPQADPTTPAGPSREPRPLSSPRCRPATSKSAFSSGSFEPGCPISSWCGRWRGSAAWRRTFRRSWAGSCWGSSDSTWERERNVLFNDALNTFYLRLYGVKTYG